jgi:hypothetical protein
MKTEANPRFFGTVCYPRLDRNDETHRLQRQRWKRGGLGWVKAAEQMLVPNR